MTKRNEQPAPSHGKHAAHAKKAPNEPPRVAPSHGKTQAIPPVVPAGVKASGVPAPHNGNGFAPEISDPPTLGSKHRAARIAGIVLGVIFGILLVVYLVGVAVFSGHFWPKATIGSSDISFQTPDEVASVLEQGIDDYSLRVRGDGLDVTLSADEAGVRFNAEQIVSDMFAQANEWAWPVEVFREHDETESLVATLDKSGVADKLHQAIDAANENTEAPVNATVAFDEDAKMFKIVKEKYGTQINTDVVMQDVERAVATLESEVELDERALSQPTIFSDDQRVIDAERAAYDGGEKRPCIRCVSYRSLHLDWGGLLGLAERGCARCLGRRGRLGLHDGRFHTLLHARGRRTVQRIGRFVWLEGRPRRALRLGEGGDRGRPDGRG